MNEMEKILKNLEKVTKKKEQAEHQIRLLNKQKSEVKRKSDTKRKIEKGGVFEKFEREITGMQEDTNNDLIYAFLDYVLSDNKNREKLKEFTEIHLKEQGIDIEEMENFVDENISLIDAGTEKI